MNRYAAAAAAIVAACLLWGVHRVLFPPEPGAETPSPGLSVESLARPAGVVGAAIDVATRGTTWATCWEDGSVTLRFGHEPMRVAPPSAAEGFRRAAVTGDGRVVAITTRGRLFDVGGAVAIDLHAKVQAGSRLAAASEGNGVVVSGEAGGVSRYDLAAGTIFDVWESGEPPSTSLFIGKGEVLLGRVEGDVVWGPIGAKEVPPPIFQLTTRITGLLAYGGWIVAGDATGRVRSQRPRTTPSGASARVDGEVFAFALPPADALGRSDLAPLLVVHAPAAATLLEGGAYDRRSSVPLGARVRAGCALDDGQAILVGTDGGERIVRVRR